MEPISLDNQEALKASPYYLARLNHLEEQNPQALLLLLEKQSLSEHLLERADQAVQSEANLVEHHQMDSQAAKELVMAQLVADPEETSQLNSLERARLSQLLKKWKSQNQTETTAPAPAN